MWVALNNIVKRCLDILLAAASLIVLSPLMVVCALWIKRDSEGPVLFKQDRRTKHGRVFRMYKFRSMVMNAENMGTGLFNYEDDPRVTKSGRFLRTTSIDELPQLFNVLKGDMSLVGPRPCVTYELGDFDTLNRRFKKRFEAVAGITGYAQIQGRNELPWDVKADYDGRYIDLFRRWGVLLDAYIILKTFAGVFARKDIYENKKDGSLTDEKAAELANEEIIRLAHEQP